MAIKRPCNLETGDEQDNQAGKSRRAKILPGNKRLRGEYSHGRTNEARSLSSTQNAGWLVARQLEAPNTKPTRVGILRPARTLGKGRTYRAYQLMRVTAESVWLRCSLF
jgi:hypothetical protein